MALRSTGRRDGSRSTSSSSSSRTSASAASADHRPDKRLGQHFLRDENILARIVAALELQPGDTAIEVGPGPGALTAKLLAAGARVIAVEIDGRFTGALRERFRDRANFSLLQADVLSLSPADMLAAAGQQPDAPYLMAGNLPYNIGAAVVRHFLEATPPPQRSVVMLQREVAAAMVARPGDHGLLAIATQVYAEPRRLFNVPPGAFQPPPKVVSSVIRLDTRAEPLVPAAERDHFFAVVRAGFSTPRKQVHNALEGGLSCPPEVVAAALRAAGIDGKRRPGELSIAEWRRLALALPQSEDR